MNALDMLKTQKINVQLEVDGIRVETDKTPVTIKFSTLSILEALVIRTIFAQPIPVVYPGTDTSKMLREMDEELAKQKREAHEKNKVQVSTQSTEVQDAGDFISPQVGD